MATDYTKLVMRIEKLELEVEALKEEVNTLDNLRETSVILKTQYQNIIQTLSEVREDVKTLKSKPAKYWESIILALLAGGIGFIISKVFGV